MAEKIIDVQVYPPPQSVVDALAALGNACREWPTKQVTIDTAKPQMPTHPKHTAISETLACDVVIGGPSYVSDAMEQTAWWGVAAGVICAIVLWAMVKCIRSIWSMVSTVWRNYQAERHA